MINLEAMAERAARRRSCSARTPRAAVPVKTQNAFNPTVASRRPPTVAPVEPNEALAELFDGGAQFEAGGARAADHLVPRTGCRSSAAVRRHSRGADRGLCPGHGLRALT